MQRISVAGVLIPLLIVFAAGCGSISSMLAEPELSENFALEAECNVPELVDGSMYSRGNAKPAEYIRGQRADDSRFTDILVTFKEPKEIRRVVLRRRSEDSTALDVNIFVMKNDEWKMIHDLTRGEMDDDLKISVRTNTDKLKIRVQRASRTSKGKSSVTSGTSRSGRSSRTQVETILREPIKFAEVEVYGLKPAAEAEAPKES